jgi:hypothetical protein
VRVECDIAEVEIVNDEGRDVPGIEAICSRCDHATTAYGTSGRSVRRCLVLMREECPIGEDNYYVDDGTRDD